MRQWRRLRRLALSWVCRHVPEYIYIYEIYDIVRFLLSFDLFLFNIIIDTRLTPGAEAQAGLLGVAGHQIKKAQ